MSRPSARQTKALNRCMALLESVRPEILLFAKGVRDFFEDHPTLRLGNPPAIHSVKWRVKDATHVRDKLLRKSLGSIPTTAQGLLRQVTDLAGVRVLHLYQGQFQEIHAAIDGRCQSGDWTLKEKPVAYTWDPESIKFFGDLGLKTAIKPTFYTSIHYVVKPRPGSSISCEIQVRTLFEEIWGEIDHALNYPAPTANLPCAEQLRVLSKLTGAGTRLADAIFRTAARADGRQPRPPNRRP